MSLVLPVGCAHTASEMDVASNADGLCPLCLQAEIERLRAALQGIVDSLASQDEEGLIEHAPQMEAARRALAGVVEHRGGS